MATIIITRATIPIVRHFALDPLFAEVVVVRAG